MRREDVCKGIEGRKVKVSEGGKEGLVEEGDGDK